MGEGGGAQSPRGQLVCHRRGCKEVYLSNGWPTNPTESYGIITSGRHLGRRRILGWVRGYACIFESLKRGGGTTLCFCLWETLCYKQNHFQMLSESNVLFLVEQMCVVNMLSELN